MRKLCKSSSNSRHSFKCFLLLFDYSTFSHFFPAFLRLSRRSCSIPANPLIHLYFLSLCKYFVIRSKLNGKVINFLLRIENFPFCTFSSTPEVMRRFFLWRLSKSNGKSASGRRERERWRWGLKWLIKKSQYTSTWGISEIPLILLNQFYCWGRGNWIKIFLISEFSRTCSCFHVECASSSDITFTSCRNVGLKTQSREDFQFCNFEFENCTQSTKFPAFVVHFHIFGYFRTKSTKLGENQQIQTIHLSDDLQFD